MTSPDAGSEPLWISLFEERGETSRFVHAEITDKGDLVLSAEDVGKAPLEHWGDEDYEFWTYVRKEHKDQVLMALIEAQYGGHFHAVDEFRDFLRARGIPCEFDSWV